ncbi:flagellar biosynthesis protein FlhF [Halalkalibacter krulwichiae]|uniref:Flagellar biosynthesis protein FlhF n=1 Tax=Halalkalibacter krulwichiae TaxID=199441 RepID=A0A1X9MK41_9BACI|nr:flagellar biosynthesis protein FlhF [Halalkalibacter krulwichiae]ARK30982.1 Flagellar biosynthesis protein FlhF [Halalkalibacter krulwichiae]
MKVKKYTAQTMNEAMKIVRSELGDDAVILNSKEVETGGFLGFFTKKQIEVIAAIDSSVKKRPFKKQIPDFNLEKELPLSQVRKESLQHQTNVINEIEQLKKLIQEFTDKKGSGTTKYPDPFQKVEEHLYDQGVTEKVRLILMKHLLKNWYEQEDKKTELSNINKDLTSYIASKLAPLSIGGFEHNKRVINLVGPTGVGKTTTIAKLAAHFVMKKQKKVALITTDTYRIAAVDQLKTYAKILNIPLEVAYSIDDFKNALEQFRHYDLVLVDSAGRNFRNPLYVEELNKLIDFNKNTETYLVLSLTSKYGDMKDILNQFHLIPIHKVILTKKDETSTYGAMLNIPMEMGKGIAYVTNGQNVPDDLIEASTPFLLDCLFEVNE